MAEEKKPEKKEETPPPKKDAFTEVVIYILAFVVLMYILNSLVGFFLHNPILNAVIHGKLSRQELLLSKTRPIASLFNPIGAKIVTTDDGVKVYDTPGGKVIATKKMGTKGEIIGGPVQIGNQKYWEVRFEDGTTGWVAESDIAVDEGVSSKTMTIVLILGRLLSALKYFIWLLSGALIVGIYYLMNRLGALRANQAKLLYPDRPLPVAKDINPKWQRVMDHIESQNENDWRLAILEADIMLDDLLEKLGLPGETMGDKLKSVERSDFTTIDNAWEAHKIRNQIAHEGQDFAISSREARRIVELYRSVFEEFEVV